MNLEQLVVKSLKFVLITCVFGNIILFLYLPQESGNKWELSDQKTSGNIVNDQETNGNIVNDQGTNGNIVYDQKTNGNIVHDQETNGNIVHNQETNGKTTKASQKSKTETTRKQNNGNVEASDKKTPRSKDSFGIGSMKTVNYSKQEKAQRFITMHSPKGQLGNQMFQLAVLLGLADRKNMVPFLSTHFPDLDTVFDLPVNLYRNISISGFKLFQQNERVRSFDLEYIDQTQNWTLDGYFQFYMIFSHIENKVRDIFKFHPHFIKDAKEFMAENVPENHVKIGIHVRRGDYISGYQRKLGRHSPGVEFYNNAKHYYSLRFPNVTFIVVSDNKQWCRENLMSDDTVFSYHKHKGVDLAILSLCDHTIVSVGTFSWWGAWLAGGTVVCYCQEFTPGSQLDQQFVQEDYYPNRWIKF